MPIMEINKMYLEGPHEYTEYSSIKDSSVVIEHTLEITGGGIDSSKIQANNIILKGKITGRSVIVGNLIVDVKNKEDLDQLIGKEVVLVGLINGISPATFFKKYDLHLGSEEKIIKGITFFSRNLQITTQYSNDFLLVNNVRINKNIISSLKSVFNKQTQTENHDVLLFSGPKFMVSNLADWNKELYDYLNYEIKNKKTSFKKELEKFEIPSREQFNCMISKNLVEIPVFVGGYLFDFDSIRNLPVNSEGKREYKELKLKFTMSDVQPGRMIFNEIIKLISKAEAEMDDDANWELMKEPEISIGNCKNKV